MLTVSQLIQELSKYSPDMPVMVDGYEGGYCAVEPEKIFQHLVFYNPREEYYGKYQTAQTGQSNESEQVLIISRKGKREYD